MWERKARFQGLSLEKSLEEQRAIEEGTSEKSKRKTGKCGMIAGRTVGQDGKLIFSEERRIIFF